MAKINREQFLSILQSVAPGLSPRETIEQSSCFVFREGEVLSFNEEVACSHAVPVNFTGAVSAEPLMAILGKLTEEIVDVDLVGNEVVVGGKRRQAGIRLDSEILLPVDSVEKPEEWKRLPEGFTEAINICQQCAGKDETKFYLTCVHLHPKWIEASDDFQISRFKIATGISESSLVRRDSIKSILDMGVVELSETPTWIHFRNTGGLVLSCRRYMENYPSEGITKFLKSPGEPVALPKGLRDAADRAQIFSKENADSNQVLVELKPGKVRLKGIGVNGWYTETGKVKYQGNPIAFLISPAVLMDITQRHNEFLIGESVLRVDAGRFQYASCLSASTNGETETEE